MKDKILVISTGGTIGSSISDNVINVDPSSTSSLHQDHHFDVCSPYNMLSENMIPSNWEFIARFIRLKLANEHVGVIVTHGTDTLPFTSSALSYALRDLKVPLVVVSSNGVLSCSNSNGLANFTAAVTFIRSGMPCGVFVIYEDSNRDLIVHLGTRLTTATPFTHQFRSQKDAYFGKIVDNRFVHNAHYRPSIPDLISSRSALTGENYFSDQIWLINPYPGLDYRMFDLTNNTPKAILHDLYHSGTGCVDSKSSNNLILFAERCSALGIPIYVSSLVPYDQHTPYMTTDMLSSHVTALPDIATEAAYTKLSMAYGSFSDSESIRRFMEEDTFFEYIR